MKRAVWVSLCVSMAALGDTKGRVATMETIPGQVAPCDGELQNLGFHGKYDLTGALLGATGTATLEAFRAGLHFNVHLDDHGSYTHPGGSSGAQVDYAGAVRWGCKRINNECTVFGPDANGKAKHDEGLVNIDDQVTSSFDSNHFGMTCLASNSSLGAARFGNDNLAGIGKLAYDAKTRELKFPEVPIRYANHSGTVSHNPALADDALLRAHIVISKMKVREAPAAAQKGKGKPAATPLFEGGTLRITLDGKSLLEASLPLLLVEDAATKRFGQNLYAVLTDIVEPARRSRHLSHMVGTYQAQPDAPLELFVRTKEPIEKRLQEGRSFEVDVVDIAVGSSTMEVE
jgi:hypothetical protein